MLAVYLDGSVEPFNPGGTASYGMVVYQEGVKKVAKGEIIGSGFGFSNNVAEYAGLLEFLRLWDGVESAIVYSDSQLLVKQMSGEWRAHKGLYLESYLKAKEICRGKPIKFVWIPREENGEADGYSLRALASVGVSPRKR